MICRLISVSKSCQKHQHRDEENESAWTYRTVAVVQEIFEVVLWLGEHLVEDLGERRDRGEVMVL